MSKIINIVALSLLVLVTACSKNDDNNTQETTSVAVSDTPDSQAARALEEMVITTDNGQYEMQVEVANTKETLYHGLMGRTSLADNSGLLMNVSLLPQDTEIAMWMKNTLIPLDMVFIDENGIVFYTFENAQPNDTTPIVPTKRPYAVLEINAGQVAQYDIKSGSVIKHALFRNL